MEEDYVSYEISLRMRALGFNEDCPKVSIWRDKRDKKFDSPLDDEFHCSIYDYIRGEGGATSAPIKQSAFKWFRDNYGLVPDFEYYGEWNYEILRIDEIMCELQDDLNLDYTFMGGSYEEAELDCLEKMCEIVELNNKK